MAYAFPNAGTKAAAHVNPHVLECLAQPERLPVLKDAKINARNFFATTTSGATGLYSMTLLANDDVALVFLGSRGACRTVWNFGQLDR